MYSRHLVRGCQWHCSTVQVCIKLHDFCTKFQNFSSGNTPNPQRGKGLQFDASVSGAEPPPTSSFLATGLSLSLTGSDISAGYNLSSCIHSVEPWKLIYSPHLSHNLSYTLSAFWADVTCFQLAVFCLYVTLICSFLHHIALRYVTLHYISVPQLDSYLTVSYLCLYSLFLSRLLFYTNKRWWSLWCSFIKLSWLCCLVTVSIWLTRNDGTFGDTRKFSECDFTYFQRKFQFPVKNSTNRKALRVISGSF